jgi:hypothetical protein
MKLSKFQKKMNEIEPSDYGSERYDRNLLRLASAAGVLVAAEVNSDNLRCIDEDCITHELVMLLRSVAIIANAWEIDLDEIASYAITDYDK